MTVPKDLKTEGRRIWKQITADYNVCGNEITLHELCRTADRLAEIRDRRRVPIPPRPEAHKRRGEGKAVYSRACGGYFGLQTSEIPLARSLSPN